MSFSPTHSSTFSSSSTSLITSESTSEKEKPVDSIAERVETVASPAASIGDDVSRGRLIRSPCPKVFLEKERYVYHSVSGCNLDQLTSILARGVLSKKAADLAGITTQSTGFGLNGDSFVSVSTHEVLTREAYSGKHLGVIIDPNGLYLKPYNPRDPSQIPFERRISFQVRPERIVGITVPPIYAREGFTNCHLFYIPATALLRQGMESLDQFYLRTLKVSLLADERLQASFARALFFPQEVKKIPETSGFYISKEALQKQRQTEFDEALNERLRNIYSEAIKKDSFSLVDVVRFHVGDTMPIYLTTGEQILAETIPHSDRAIA